MSMSQFTIRELSDTQPHYIISRIKHSEAQQKHMHKIQTRVAWHGDHEEQLPSGVQVSLFHTRVVPLSLCYQQEHPLPRLFDSLSTLRHLLARRFALNPFSEFCMLLFRAVFSAFSLSDFSFSAFSFSAFWLSSFATFVTGVSSWWTATFDNRERATWNLSANMTFRKA